MQIPWLDASQLEPTKQALHAYAKVLGQWLKRCRSKRKHWWHASLRPSLNGLTTGVVHGAPSFELEIDLLASTLCGATDSGERLIEPLHGQSAAELATAIDDFLARAGVESRAGPSESDTSSFAYDAGQARQMHAAVSYLTAALTELRAGIPEETSPIQIWPHHFDLSMLWLPGEKVPDTDPTDEESSDKQMNFGFTFGDAGIPEPYLYVTAYPTPAAMAELELPAGAVWRSADFTGAVIGYATLARQADPTAYIHDVWNRLIAAGRQHLLEPRE